MVFVVVYIRNGFTRKKAFNSLDEAARFRQYVRGISGVTRVLYPIET